MNWLDVFNLIDYQHGLELAHGGLFVRLQDTSFDSFECQKLRGLEGVGARKSGV